LDWYDLRGWRWMSAKRSCLLSASVGCVLADAWFDSERSHTFCREQLKADSTIEGRSAR
jgi:hypothetical protein